MKRAALLAFVLVACGGREPLEHAADGIRGGVEAPEDRGVVAVVNFAGGHCSGALIAPQLVLTARHCVAETEGEELQVVCGQTPFEAPDSPGAIFVVAQPTITENEADYAAVTAIRMPPELGDDLCGSDVVLLVLKNALSSIAPLLPRLERAVEPGEVYAAVGYGIDEAVEGKPSGVRKRLDGLEVTCSGAACGAADVRDNEWVGSGGPCSGDSGGPALDEGGQVIGVVSRGTTGCEQPVFGDVATRSAWLVAEAVAAANAAGVAPPRWALCGADESCAAPRVEEPAAASHQPEATCAAAPRPVGVAWAVPWLLAGALLWPRRRRLRP